MSGVFRPGRLAEVLVEASQLENHHKPYFVCLDEMNLARVEYYFSDVLSVIETQEWKQDRIVTSKLINRESLLPEDQSIYGDLSIPDNVYLIGTVNMDETTHPFSKRYWIVRIRLSLTILIYSNIRALSRKRRRPFFRYTTRSYEVSICNWLMCIPSIRS